MSSAMAPRSEALPGRCDEVAARSGARISLESLFSLTSYAKGR